MKTATGILLGLLALAAMFSCERSELAETTTERALSHAQDEGLERWKVAPLAEVDGSVGDAEGYGSGEATKAGRRDVVLTISSDPPSATIMINSQLIRGPTTRGGLIEPGTYQIQLELEGYKPLKQSHQVFEHIPSTFHRPLERQSTTGPS